MSPGIYGTLLLVGIGAGFLAWFAGAIVGPIGLLLTLN